MAPLVIRRFVSLQKEPTVQIEVEEYSEEQQGQQGEEKR